VKLNQLMQLLRDNAQARAEGEPSIRVDAGGDATGDAHVYVYDVIDAWWGASADALISALQPLGSRTVHLHVNSPGGDVFEARAMAAAVVAHPGQVHVHIDGLAASAATYVAMAGNTLSMTEGGMLMVHESWTISYGNKHELRKTTALLDQIDGLIAADYVRQTGAALDQVVAWMQAETWFTAAAALEAKFIDSIDPGSKREAQPAASAARWNLSAYANAPKLPPVANDPAMPEAVARQLQANRNRLRALHAI
jgi:ATP-dependent Clp protease protease subunit